MSDAFERRDAPRTHRDKEYEDFHFHDEDDVVPADDLKPGKTQVSARRKPSGPPPPRRRYEED